MRSTVIVFPGSNCDRDAAFVLRAVTGQTPTRVWHADAELPATDLIVLPGGFSYGDFLRCGAMAARARIMPAIVAAAGCGVPVLGICNGFQILCEAGLLPGVLMRNAGMRFICRDVKVRVETSRSFFLGGYAPGSVIQLPIAHAEGNYSADPATLDRLAGDGQIALRYCDAAGTPSLAANPNGAAANIAGILDTTGRVLGMMPHPERAADSLLGGTDGRALFESAVAAVAGAC
jgi:phosphoribosylformylglycinamidine synthase subunit PurQ / glutaminase